MHIQPQSQVRSYGRGEAPTALFEIEKSVLVMGRKVLVLGRKVLVLGRKVLVGCVHFWVKFSIQNVVLRVSSRKISEMFPCRASFSCAFDEMFISKYPSSTDLRIFRRLTYLKPDIY